MSAQTLIFDAYAAYLSLVRGVAGSVIVFDGPQVQYASDQSFVVVGCDDILSTGMVGAVTGGGQTWESLGAQRRMEQFDIPSTLVVWHGEADLAPLRSTAQTFINSLGAAIRPAPYGTGDAMLNAVLNESGAGWCGLSVGGVQAIQDRDGSAIHVRFDLNCVAYL